MLEKFGLDKIRKVNQDIGNRLKKNYNFRYQICGRRVGEFYGVKHEEFLKLNEHL